MVNLEENGYASLQSAADHSLEKILHDEISDFKSAIPPRNGNSSIILQVWNISLFLWSIHVI